MLGERTQLNVSNPENSNGWNAPGLDTVTASGAAIWSVYSLLSLGDSGVLAGAEGGDLDTTMSSAPQYRKRREHTPGKAIPQSPHFGAVPRFFKW